MCHLLQILNKLWIGGYEFTQADNCAPQPITHVSLSFFCQLPVSRLELQQALKSQAGLRRHLAIFGREVDKKVDGNEKNETVSSDRVIRDPK